ncbi:MAG: glutaminase [Bacteroidota bacterium]
MDYQRILEGIYQDIKKEEITGNVADYIPELAKVDSMKFGIHLCTLEGKNYQVGDSQTRFSIQSIVKVLALAFAVKKTGKEAIEKILSRVGVEPSGDPFNSLAQLEYENGVPRNPLINAGALVVCDILLDYLTHPKKEFLEFVRQLTNNNSIDYDSKVALSEKAFGYRNAALANLMKSFGNIRHEVEEVLDFYFYQCSIAMSCQELAQAFLLFANDGKLFPSNERIVSSSRSKRINAIMMTCGFYDEAGEFSFRVGLPGKSGVGGGIVAVYPGNYSVAVWSPPLNPKGNSTLGMLALEYLTTRTGFSIF